MFNNIFTSSKKKVIKAIILDFDGVIADSVEVKTDAFAVLYHHHGKNIVEKVVHHHRTHGGMFRYEKFRLYHKEYLDIILTDEEVDELASAFSRIVVEKVIAAPFVPGALEFIIQNYIHYNMFVSTGTPLTEMKTILKQKKLNVYFSDVYGAPENKSEHILHIFDKYQLKPEEILFIGDAITDVNSAFEHKIPFILRIHKYNREQFENYKGKIIKDLREIDMHQLNYNDLV